MSVFDDLSGPYGTIVADPPWQYKKKKQDAPDPTHSRQFVSDRYSQLTMRQIADLPVAGLAAPDAHLYLWVTVPRLFSDRDDPSLFGPAQIMQAWGFRYVTALTWVKSWPKDEGGYQGRMGMGSYMRIDTEHCLFGVRGHAPIPPELRKRNTIFAPATGHSVKPEALQDLAEAVSPGPRCELFARRQRLGWDGWGHGYEQVAV